MFVCNTRKKNQRKKKMEKMATTKKYNLTTKILGLVTSQLLNEDVNFEPYNFSEGQWESPKKKTWEEYSRQERRKWITG